MPTEMPSDGVEEIQVDLDPELILSLMKASARTALSEASQTYLLKHLEERQDGDPINDADFAALGRSVFNEIMLRALESEVRRVETLKDAVDAALGAKDAD